ncbi:MAG TPA: hypothetical protein VKZ45_07130 [Vicingaceae bacterium]|jgi:hypothetical protein|nr:hypothetical protein [Vicingaceae bacterium]
MLRKVISILLVFVVVFTTSGFTISSHICKGKKVETVVGLRKLDVSCGMEEAKKEKNCSNENNFNSNCCQNEFQTFLMTEDYVQEVFELKTPSSFFVLWFVIMDLNLETGFKNLVYNVYLPPPIQKDIPVLFQSFLI